MFLFNMLTANSVSYSNPFLVGFLQWLFHLSPGSNMHHAGSQFPDAITASLQLPPVSPCKGLAVSHLRKATLEQQAPAPGPGGLLYPILLLSLKKHFDLLALHYLSQRTLVRRELWNSRPPCLPVLGVRFGGFSFSIQMSLLDLTRSAL